jgi:phage shock protein E
MDRSFLVVLVLAAATGVAACEGASAEHDVTPDAAVSRGAATAGPAAGGGQPAARAERGLVYVDVRTPGEFAAGHVEGAIHIPYTELATRWAELDAYRDSDIVLYCRTGRRSRIAEEILRQAGFERLENGGGLSDLARRGVPVVR